MIFKSFDNPEDELYRENSMKEELHDLCLEILSHAAIDGEVTIDGNGVCSSEASVVARKILKICGIKCTQREIKKRATELAKEEGWSEEDIKDYIGGK